MHFKFKHSALVVALALAAAPVYAQSNQEILKELEALKSKVNELESKLKAQAEQRAEQTQDFNRVAIKAEALEDSRDALGFKGLKISGFMDPTFIYNKAANRAGVQFLTNMAGDGADGYAIDSSYFGSVVLDLVKETDGGSRWHLTLAPNRGVGTVFNSTSIVQEASVSIPLSDLQTRFIAGQIPDWSGYEMLQAPLNKLVTHNLLFDLTLPPAYTGAGFELTRGKWITKTLLGNMSSSRKPDNNKSPMFAYRIDYAKGEFQGFGVAGVLGKASNFTQNVLDTDGNAIPQPESMLSTIEADGYFIRGDWTVQGHIAMGQQKKASITAGADGELRTAYWKGVSALAAYKFTPRFEGVVRADYIENRRNGGGLLGYSSFDGRNGIGPGFSYDADSGTWKQADPNRGSNRSALSLGVNYLYDLNTQFRLEYRMDRSTGAVFYNAKDGSYTKQNQIFGASVLVTF